MGKPTGFKEIARRDRPYESIAQRVRRLACHETQTRRCTWAVRPIGKRAMTDAERQRRRRKRLQKERAAADRKIKLALARQKNRQKYIPMPPGITYWHRVTVEASDGPREIMVPQTRPLAACESDLEDDDVLALIE